MVFVVMCPLSLSLCGSLGLSVFVTATLARSLPLRLPLTAAAAAAAAAISLSRLPLVPRRQALEKQRPPLACAHDDNDA